MIPKKLASRLAALLAACCLLSVPALAAETGELALPGGPAPKLTQLSFPEGEDNDELFSAYVSQRLFAAANAGVSPLSAQDPAGDRLVGDVNKRAYSLLKEKIETTAKSGGSAMYTLTSEELGQKTEWTFEELKDLDNDPENPLFGDSQEMTDEILEQIVSLLFDQVSAELDALAVENALLVDCPFDLYWFDKTLGVAFWAQIAEGGGFQNETLSLSLEYRFNYRVAEAYRDEDYVQIEVDGNNNITNLETFKLVVTTDVSRVQAAASAAAAIVAKHQAKSDYEKLLAYKDEICALTAYNGDAANPDNNVDYGDPWQLIHVFDGDPGTNVVCEGYAKAFQYLCDLTDFGGDVACYLVEGTMSGGTGDGGDGQPGPHMWNIVRIGGRSYLVDVTNSDEGSIGQDGGLFLAGTAERGEAGYVFRPAENNPVTYQYNKGMIAAWGEQVLTLAEESYSPAPSETGKIAPVAPPEDGRLTVSGSAGQPSWLLVAGYDQDNRLKGVFWVQVEGAYNEELPLPDGTLSWKVLLTGGESWSPLCGAVASE